MIAYLQTLGGTPTVTLQTKHHYNTARRTGRAPAPRRLRRQAQRRAQRQRAGAAGPSTARRQRLQLAAPPGRGSTMNILVVLAVVAVFGLLRFRRANLLMWALRLVGRDLRPPAIRVHGADSLLRHLDLHGHRLARDPGVRVLQPGAPRRGLRPARPVHDREAVHPAPRRNGRRHPGARGRERLRADERPARSRRSSRERFIRHRRPRSRFTTRRSISTPERTRSVHLETSNPAEFRKHVENGRQVYYRNCVFCHGDNMAGNGMFVHGLDPIPTNFADPGRSRCCARRFCSGGSPREARAFPRKAGPGTRRCRPGRSS